MIPSYMDSEVNGSGVRPTPGKAQTKTQKTQTKHKKHNKQTKRLAEPSRNPCGTFAESLETLRIPGTLRNLVEPCGTFAEP